MRSFFFASLLAIALPAAAETVTYTVSNVVLVPYYSSIYADPGTLAGTFNIDTTADAYGTENLTFTSTSGDGLVITFNGTPSTNAAPTGFSGFTFSVLPDPTGQYALSLALPGNTVDDYTGGPVCSMANSCGVYSGIFFPNGPLDDPAVNLELSQFATGTASSGTGSPGSSPAATPEPSSLALLGTGILTLVGAARRRFQRS